MKKCVYIVGLILVFSTGLGFGQESMTPARFREIVNLPGDMVPLVPQLAPVPFWTNAVVSNVMTYASGKVFREVMTQTARTVGGKYVVFTVYSQFYQKPMSGVLAFDEKATALKMYGLFGDGHGGDVVTEGTLVNDYVKKTYTATSSYGDGFKETTAGSYTDKEDFAKTMVYKNGVLFMTREATTHPVTSSKPASLST
jgi:hypothetical protein